MARSFFQTLTLVCLHNILLFHVCKGECFFFHPDLLLIQDIVTLHLDTVYLPAWLSTRKGCRSCFVGLH